MAGGEQASHRPGLLKQQNKSHKSGRHRSKSEIDKTNKGKKSVLFCVGKKNYVCFLQAESGRNFQLKGRTKN